MKKRFLTLALAGVLSLSLLAACSSGGSNGEGAPSPDPTPSVEPSDAPESTPSELPEEQPSQAPDQPSEEPSAQPSQKPNPTPSPAPTQEPAPSPDAPSTGSVDLSSFYRTVADAYELPGMMEITGDAVASLYPGLEQMDLKQSVLYTAMISATVGELSLVEAANADDAAAVAAIFQARIDAQVDGGAWYPATIEGWEQHSQVVVQGNYVMLVAFESDADIVNDFNALF